MAKLSGGGELESIQDESENLSRTAYLKGYATMGELRAGLTEYFAFYNGERPHQSLGNQTPQGVYRTAIGGGAVIVDKFGGAGGGTPVERSGTGVPPPAEARSTATAQTKAKAKPGQRRPAATEVKCPA
jgi:putative transposase